MATLRPLWLSLGTLSERLRGARVLNLAADFDGTLTPIVEHPNVAELSDRARQVIERMTRRDDVRVAIISGRNLDDLQKHVDVRGVFLTGAAGLETQNEHGQRTRHLSDDQVLPGELRASLEQWCTRFPGSWVEDKSVAFALHYRGVAPDLQPAFGAGVRRRVRPFKQTARLIHGKRVFEVMPAVSWDKASAIQVWLDRAPDRGLLLFFGDDTNDEPVHELIRRRDGMAIAVGRTVSRAEYVLPSPREVVWFLEWLEREWANRGGPGEADAQSDGNSREEAAPTVAASGQPSREIAHNV